MAVTVDPTMYRAPNRLVATERSGARQRIVPRPVPIGPPAGWGGHVLATVLRDTTTMTTGTVT